MSNRILDLRMQYAIDLLVHTRAMHQKFVEIDSSFARQILNEGVRLLRRRQPVGGVIFPPEQSGRVCVLSHQFQGIETTCQDCRPALAPREENDGYLSVFAKLLTLSDSPAKQCP